MSIHTPTKVTIRPFAPADYAAVVAVNNAAFPDYPDTADQWRFTDEHRDPTCHFARFVAERDGELVGLAECGQRTGMFHPQKFFVGVTVHPGWQGQGIGTALYDHVAASLEPFAPISFAGSAREDWDRSLRFLAQRGYVERMRSWESRLDVAAFDPAPFAEAGARAEAGGIAIATYADLAADPARDRKLFTLSEALNDDVPHPEPRTPISFEWYAERVLNDPDLLPDAWFVAIDRADGAYVGMSQLWNTQASPDLYTGLTGVLRSHRRRGIALALKLRAVAYARAQGRPTIRTWNESNNRPMLAINEAMGFRKQPAWIDFVLALCPDQDAAPPPTEDPAE